MSATTKGDKARIHLYLPAVLKAQIADMAYGANLSLYGFILQAVRFDMRLRHRYGTRYQIISSLLDRLDPKAVEAALMEVAKQ